MSQITINYSKKRTFYEKKDNQNLSIGENRRTPARSG